jgi:hypothetical protein
MGYLDIALKAKARMEVQNNPHGLIDRTLEEIARDYQPGVLPWTKANRPDGWRKMLIAEQKINKMPMSCDLDGLRGALSNYQGLILAMVKEFKSQPSHGRQGTFAFEEMG